MLRLRSSNGFPKQFMTSSIYTTFNHLLQFSDVASSTTTTSINPKTQNDSPLSSSTGFRDAQIRCLLSTSPTLLAYYDVEKTRKPKIQGFQDLGLSVPAIKRSNWLIQPNILFLTKKCGMSDDKNQKFLLSNARHFMNKPDRVDDDEKNTDKDKDLIKKGPNSPLETILREVRIRFMWTSSWLCLWHWLNKFVKEWNEVVHRLIALQVFVRIFGNGLVVPWWSSIIVPSFQFVKNPVLGYALALFNGVRASPDLYVPAITKQVQILLKRMMELIMKLDSVAVFAEADPLGKADKIKDLQVGIGRSFQLHATGWKWKLSTGGALNIVLTLPSKNSRSCWHRGTDFQYQLRKVASIARQCRSNSN
ncbi:hypothetical protein MKW98_020065 [Papaver atlanticum]|uniref:DUF7781 domain-containing protein n=1 Tax=Papaver atlanticum TaxID=357466 RepID=A0AAD4S103_9MAGN|nr:hypothetical protein MKW98_020065 [Papaver atlanticum]